MSSTSSDDSSCDESRFRGRLRVGMKMGILHEGSTCSSSGQSHSDPDYTSSSEQSCDTVIYVGRNGQLLSDRELTDNEGPPSMIPIIPRASGSGASKSSGDEGQSSGGDTPQDGRINKPLIPKCGASMINNSRLPMRNKVPSTTPESNRNTASRPSSPPAVMSLPRKSNLKPSHQRPKAYGEESERTTVNDRSLGRYKEKSMDTGEGTWIDGPAAFPREPQQPQWLDGPQGYSAPCGQGVPASTAGVPASPVIYSPYQSPVHKPTTDPASSEQWIDGPNAPTPAPSVPSPVPPRRETWVDGPKEFCIGKSADSRTRHERPSKMHKEMARAAHASRGQPASKGVKEGKSRTSELRNPTIGAVADPRPVSHISMESTTSVTVNPNSRPVSEHEESDRDAVKHSQNNNPDLAVCDAEAGQAGEAADKSFVQDWVDKHSLSTDVNENPPSSPNPKHKHRHTRSVQLSLEERSSPERKSASAHSSPNMRRQRRLQQALPPPANPTSRTAEWVMSVQQTDSASPTPSRRQAAKSDAVRPSKLACTEEVLPVDDGSPPPAYEACLDPTRTDEPTEEDEDTAVKERLCPELLSSQSTTEHVMTNSRDSIYEVEAEEQLERAKSDASHRMTFNSEDAWSSRDVSMEEGTETGVGGTTLDDGVSTLDTSRNTQVESHLTLNTDRESGMVLCPGEHLSPPSSDDSDRIISSRLVRPSCLRRPDGASNPNLSSGDPPKPPVDSSPDVMKPTFLPLATSTAKSVAPCMPESIQERSVIGQSPEGIISPSKTVSVPRGSGLPVKGVACKSAATKPIVSSKPVSALPKPAKKSPTSPGKSAEKPVVPPRISSFKNSSHNRTDSVEKASSSPTKVVTPSKVVSPSKASKDKQDKSGRSSKPVSPSPTHTTAQSRTTPTSQPTKSPRTYRFFGRSKSQSSPTKSSSSASSKETCKSISRTASKSPSPTKREKDSKLPVKFGRSVSTGHKRPDSDSGNDSGIVKNDKHLLSPYHKLTKPRVSMHSSSGHGSEESSMFDHDASKTTPVKVKASKTEVSSGYESMLRDSEATASSSNHDSTSESSSGGRVKANKSNKKKAIGTLVNQALRMII